MKLCLLLFLVAVFCPCAQAQKAPYTPKPGSAERRLILNALRVPVQKSLKNKPVVFEISHFKVQSGWAFLSGTPRLPGGKPMDYRGTDYQAARADGVFDDWFCALLRKEKKGWRVVVWQIGATDVAWAGWDASYKAPHALFPYPPAPGKK